jgi:hypothetical protein
VPCSVEEREAPSGELVEHPELARVACDSVLSASHDRDRTVEDGLRVYVDHYNRERPHRALELRPPDPDEPQEGSHVGKIHRRDRLGGLIHEYHRAAA